MASKRERKKHGCGEPAKPWKGVYFIQNFDKSEVGPAKWNDEALDVANLDKWIVPSYS